MITLKNGLDQLIEEKKKTDLKQLLNDPQFVKIPKAGEVIRGKVLSVSRSLVRLDVDGLYTGVVRGAELYAAPEYVNLKEGDEVEATVVEIDNENGEFELSFREAGHRKTWGNIETWQKEGKAIQAMVKDANRGGLILNVDSLLGFMPVSQLNPDHYPRVAGGDKNRILEKLRSFIGQTFNVKIIDVDEKTEKLIVSEKAVWEEEKKNLLSSYKVGDIIEGTVSALADFGAFVRFGEVEGLAHISELAWQRLDHPRNILKVGDKINAQIIQMDGSKIFLSLKRLVEDPWKKVGDKYQTGQLIKGKVLKINPFGLFVELDPEIHGLAHVSSFSQEAAKDLSQVAKEGEVLDFEILSIEPAEHRLGLKIAMPKQKSAEAESGADKEVEKIGAE